MKIVRKALVAGAVALACSAGPAAAQWSNFFFLGDSSTDAGFYGARFTVNPGLVWAQDLGAFHGFTITPVTQSGTDLAQGGSRVALASGLIPSGAPQRPLTTQIDQLLAATPALDPNAVYAVSIGYNDLLENLAQAGAGQITPAQLQANVATAAATLVQQIARLQAAGAQNIVVLNLYDMGRSPRGLANPTAPFTALTGLFNSTVNTGLDQLGGNVIRVNTQALFQEMLADPTSFGFTNVTSPACTTESALSCTAGTLVAANAASTFLFADTIHPTPAAHLAMAQIVNSMLTGPFHAATLPEGPLGIEQATFRTLDGRMWSALDTPLSQKGTNLWAAYDYANPDIDFGLVNGDADVSTFSFGGDIRVTDHLLAGAAVNYSQYEADYSGGSYKLDEISGTIYAGYGHGPWYVGTSLLIGELDYKDVRRSFDVGIAQRVETGETSGSHWAVRVLGGYWFKSGSVLHGPFAKLVYQEADVDGFTEGAGTSTSLRYGEQTRESLLGSLGWQAQGQWGAVRPFGRVTWEYDFKNDARTLVASSATLGGQYSVALPKPDDNWALFNFGASIDVGPGMPAGGRIAAYLMGSATAGKDDGDSYAITLGVRVPM